MDKLKKTIIYISFCCSVFGVFLVSVSVVFLSIKPNWLLFLVFVVLGIFAVFSGLWIIEERV